MYIITTAAPPIFALFALFAWIYIFQLHFFKWAQNMIIGCKLATTEYSAETFFQRQHVHTW